VRADLLHARNLGVGIEDREDVRLHALEIVTGGQFGPGGGIARPDPVQRTLALDFLEPGMGIIDRWRFGPGAARQGKTGNQASLGNLRLGVRSGWKILRNASMLHWTGGTMPTHHAAPRFARRAEHAVVYRRDNHFASHPYVRGFWETAAGDLVTNFSVATVDYRGDPLALSHLSLVRSTGGRRAVTMRSEDRGLTWHIVNEDPRRPSNDVMAPRPGVDGLPGGLPELGRVDFTDRDVLVSVFNHQYMN